MPEENAETMVGSMGGMLLGGAVMGRIRGRRGHKEDGRN
jgi:hypothetical protein